VLEGAGLDAAGLDVGVDVGLLEADDPTEAVGGELMKRYNVRGVTPRRRAAALVDSQTMSPLLVTVSLIA
jgi:hypothetical protein